MNRSRSLPALLSHLVSRPARNWRISAGFLAAICFVVPSVAEAEYLHQLKIHGAKERRSDVAFSATAVIQAPNVDALAACVARRGRALPKAQSPRRAFRGIRWNDDLKVLAACTPGNCKFNFPPWAIARLSTAKDIESKQRTYYQLLHQLSWERDKRGKRNRITAEEGARESVCAKHDLFHWLLNGPPRSWDQVVWRKHFGGKHMRPTLTTLQLSHWRQGNSRCVGGTLLFADHYYWDALELLQLTPRGDGRIELRFHRRDRLDFFGSWWARRLRSRIRNRVTKARVALLERDLKACGALDW